MKNYYSAGSRKWILLWGFTALWLVGTTLGTWSAVLNGASGPVGSPRWYPYLGVAVMWAVGAYLAWFANNLPCTSVTVNEDGVVEGRVTFPFRFVRRVLQHDEIIPLQLIEHKYEDGDTFFVLRLPVHLVPGHDMVLAEGSQDHCLAEKEAFLAAIDHLVAKPK